MKKEEMGKVIKSDRKIFMNKIHLWILLFSLSMSHNLPAKDEFSWQLLHSENFSTLFDTSNFPWEQDPLDASSKWNIDMFDDNGEVWKNISNPMFSEQMNKVRIFRQSIPFGQENCKPAQHNCP